MEDRLEREEQITQDELPVSGAFEAEQLEHLVEDQNLDPAIRELIARCMEGTEDYGRELKPWEPPKFSAIHVTMALLLAAGFRPGEICRILGYDNSRVSVVGRHPYGRKIIQAMMHKQSGRVLDIKTRLEAAAGDMLDKIYREGMKSDDLKLTSNITFALLDRAGYGPQSTVKTENKNTNVSVSEETMTRLAGALEESARVDAVIMPTRPRQLLPPGVVEDGGIGTSQEPSPVAESGFTPSAPSGPPDANGGNPR